MKVHKPAEAGWAVFWLALCAVNIHTGGVALGFVPACAGFAVWNFLVATRDL